MMEGSGEGAENFTESHRSSIFRGEIETRERVSPDVFLEYTFVGGELGKVVRITVFPFLLTFVFFFFFFFLI